MKKAIMMSLLVLSMVLITSGCMSDDYVNFNENESETVENTDKPPITTSDSTDWFKSKLKLKIVAEGYEAKQQKFNEGDRQITRLQTKYKITTSFLSNQQDPFTQDKAPNAQKTTEPEVIEAITECTKDSWILYNSKSLNGIVTNNPNIISTNADNRNYCKDGFPGYSIQNTAGIIETLGKQPIIMLKNLALDAWQWLNEQTREYVPEYNYWFGMVKVYFENMRGKGIFDEFFKKISDDLLEIPIPVRIPFPGENGRYTDYIDLWFFTPVLRILPSQWQIKFWGSETNGRITIFNVESTRNWKAILAGIVAGAVAFVLTGGSATIAIVAMIGGYWCVSGTYNQGRYKDQRKWEKASWIDHEKYRYTINEA